MTLHEEQKRVQEAVSSSLAYVQEDPWLAQRVLANAKGEEPVKKKISLALVLCIVLGLALIGTAYALFSSRVAEFYGNYYGDDFGEWLEEGKTAGVGKTVSLSGVDFTLDEVVYRDNGIYAVGTARAKDGKDALVPPEMLYAADWTDEGALDEEYRALISRTKEAGGRLLSVDCRPQAVGMDEGTMDTLDEVGFDQEYNEDGSITFCFEASDYTLEEGTVYQLEMSVQVDEWTAEGEMEEEKGAYQSWTVSFTPEYRDGRSE